LACDVLEQLNKSEEAQEYFKELQKKYK